MAVEQERRDVADFDEISMEGMGVILLKQGEREELVIEADADLLPKLKSDVNAGRLELGLRNWFDFLSLISKPRICYMITVRSLRGVSISGSGNLQAGPIETDRLRLRISGSGEMFIENLQASDLELIFSGSGKAQVSGTVQRSELEISGSGEIKAEDLQTAETQVRISGSGSAKLRVQERLDVTISGSGEVRYHGQPTIRQRISGSGSVRSI
jgi:hypothetical protein